MKLITDTDTLLVFEVPSASKPGIVHEVRYDKVKHAWWCGCPGYTFANRCSHIPDPTSKPGGGTHHSGDRGQRDPPNRHRRPSHLKGKSSPKERVRADFEHVQAGCIKLAETDAEFRDAVRHRHGGRMYTRVIEVTGGQVIPPKDVDLQQYIESLPHVSTMLRWTLPLAKELQSAEELAKGQDLRAAVAWQAERVDGGQARLA